MSGIVTATQQKAVHHSISGRVQPPIERERPAQYVHTQKAKQTPQHCGTEPGLVILHGRDADATVGK